MKTTQEPNCRLCQLPLTSRGIADRDSHFCCPGCQAVYRILEARGELEDSQNHPIFEQAASQGLISNPELLETLRKKSGPRDDLKRLTFEVEDMWCPSCADLIRFVLLTAKGVAACVVDYGTDLAAVKYDPKRIAEQDVLKLVKDLGYRPASLEDADETKKSSLLLLRLIIAAFCSLNVMMFSWPFYATYFDDGGSDIASWLPLFSFAASLPVVTFCFWPIFIRFWRGIKLGFWGMEALVTVSVLSAWSLSVFHLLRGEPYIYFDSMSVVVTLLLFGKWLEKEAKFSAKRSLLEISRSLPRRGRKQSEGGAVAFDYLKNIQLGDRLVAHAGEKIVLDGTVAEGVAFVDESLLTGEVIPCEKKKGDSVVAGTIVQSGSLVFTVTKTLKGSTLQQMVATIEQDLGTKGKEHRLVDRVVKWFIPAILALAAGSFIITADAIRSLSILLIACPCTLGIAVPLVESRIIHILTQKGAVIRNRAVLALLGRETLYVFDKTGTATEGRFSVQHGLEALCPKEKSILKALCEKSSHPVAKAINAALGVEPAVLSSFQSFTSKGLEGFIDEEGYRLGSGAWTGQKEELTESLQTVVFFLQGMQCLAKISLGDKIRPGMNALIKTLPEAHLISGDRTPVVQHVAKVCGFYGVKGDVHPLEKGEFVKAKRSEGHTVCFVGDGLNDAPAIAAADIGISVASATDMSIQASDILLTTEDLGILQEIRKLGKIGRRAMKQNLFWAFGYNVIGIGLALYGLLTPIYAAFAMVLSSLFVTLNASRIGRSRWASE